MILLNASESFSDPQITATLNVSQPCVERNLKHLVAGGLEHGRN
jgi:biotin operon repressor